MQKNGQNYVNIEVISSIGLFLAALLAVVFANSPFSALYESIINYPTKVDMPFVAFEKPFIFWINDALICLFFLLIGLEIKREVIEGELSEKSKRSMPVVGAIVGAIVSAIVYTCFNYDNPLYMRGWAIPTAMDTAFCIGVLALVRKTPKSIKIFLVSLAIIDDILAVTTITLFYAREISHVFVLASIVLMGVFALLNQFKLNSKLPFIVLGLLLWLTVLLSGVQTSVVGVLVAIAIPHRRSNNQPSMLEQFEKTLHPWVGLFVIPLFAFANAGVPISEFAWAHLLNPLSLGIILGLFVGKQLGVFGVIFVLAKFKRTPLPSGATWLQMYGAAILCGIGFTMSLFIGTLAFETGGVGFMSSIKAAIFVGSIFSAVSGFLILAFHERLQTLLK